jgi:hypothetical protein
MLLNSPMIYSPKRNDCFYLVVVHHKVGGVLVFIVFGALRSIVVAAQPLEGYLGLFI